MSDNEIKVQWTDICQFTPRQMDALNALKAGKRFLLYGGALGGGKSFWLRWTLLHRIIFIGTYLGLKKVPVMLACENYPALKDRQLQKIGTEFPEWLGKMHHEHRVFGRAFVLTDDLGGGAICFRNLDDPSKYQCFHPDTEILTRDGWINIAGVSVGDAVATMNPETREAEYRQVDKVWKYDFEGNLETIKSRGTPSFAVTPNHTVWASTKRCEKLKPYSADKLPSTAKIPQWAIWKADPKPIPSQVTFKSPGNNGRSVSFAVGDWMEFLGWYLAEGSLDPAPRYAIRISQVQQSGRERIIALLKNNGINYHAQEREISFNNRALYDFLSPLKKSHDKYIPRDVITMPQQLLDRLLWSIVEADGTWASKITGHFVTASKRLADDVSEIALRCGYRPTVTLRHDKPGQNNYGDGHKPRYHVHLTHKTSDTLCGQHRTQTPYNGKVYCVTVPPYHTVLIRHNGRVSWSGQSAEFAAIAVDELTKNDYDVFTHLRSRLRWPGLPDRETWFIAGTNPGGVGHGWVKQLWIDGIFPEEYKNPIDFTKDFAFIPSKADDNPHLDPSYWATLQTLPSNLRAAFRDGSWEVFIGQAFPQFSRISHVIKPVPIPEHAPLYMTFDWGYGRPFSVGWWFVDADGRVFRFAEWYGWSGVPNEGLRIPDTQIAEGIKEREAELGISGKVITRLAGPDCWNKKPDYMGGGQGPSTDEVFARYGIHLTPGDPSRGLKIRQFRERLTVPADGTMPMLVVFENCKQFIRTIPDLIMDEHNVEDVDTDTEDHVYDEACHICMARPISMSIPQKPKSPIDQRLDELYKMPSGDYEEYAGYEQELEFKRLQLDEDEEGGNYELVGTID